MVKRGDVVIVAVGGKEVNALVHAFNPFHEAGPSVHVSVVAEDPIDNNTRLPKVTPIGYIPESVMLHDVTAWKELSDASGALAEVERQGEYIAVLERQLGELAGKDPDVSKELQAVADAGAVPLYGDQGDTNA